MTIDPAGVKHPHGSTESGPEMTDATDWVMAEPLIHSHITDVLPDDHPLAWTNVYCEKCNVMVHAVNNECMQTWVETGRGPHCLPCLTNAPTGGTVLEDEWALREAR